MYFLMQKGWEKTRKIRKNTAAGLVLLKEESEDEVHLQNIHQGNGRVGKRRSECNRNLRTVDTKTKSFQFTSFNLFIF